MIKSLVLCVLLLSGCAIVPDAPFEALSPEKRVTNKIVLVWETVDDVDATCKKLNNSFPIFYTMHACAQWSLNYCKIYTSKKPTMAILGHELRHCFEGDFH